MPVLIEQTSTVTRKGQTTVPKPVRDALGVKSGDQVVYRVDSDGSVTLARREAAGDEAAGDESAVDAFLAFISADIKRRPEAIKPFDEAEVERMRALVEGVDLDLDGDFSDAEPI